jgi:hypothetical protein
MLRAAVGGGRRWLVKAWSSPAGSALTKGSPATAAPAEESSRHVTPAVHGRPVSPCAGIAIRLRQLRSSQAMTQPPTPSSVTRFRTCRWPFRSPRRAAAGRAVPASRTDSSPPTRSRDDFASALATAYRSSLPQPMLEQGIQLRQESIRRLREGVAVTGMGGIGKTTATLRQRVTSAAGSRDRRRPRGKYDGLTRLRRLLVPGLAGLQAVDLISSRRRAVTAKAQELIDAYEARSRGPVFRYMPRASRTTSRRSLLQGWTWHRSSSLSECVII